MTTTSPQPAIRRIAMASLIGTTIEWYDYYIFGLAAVLIFNNQFFPNLDPVAGTLASLATFGVAFVARPFGGVIFGHYGDRVGRKTMLVTSLLIMGGGTIVIGVLPNYGTIGIWAPALLVLCRILQGIAVGGEWSGAVLMAAEHAPARKRAFYASWPQCGVPLGVVLSTGVFFAVQSLPEDAFVSWGWRLPFLATSLLVAVGLYIRLSVAESPEFKAVKDSDTVAKLPVAEVFRTSKKQLLLGILVLFAPNIPFYIATVFLLTYVPAHTSIDRGSVLMTLMVVSILEALAIPYAAALGDRFGRSKLLMLGAASYTALAFPIFWLTNTGSELLLLVALALMLPVAHSLSYAAVASYISDLFEPRVRYTGSALAYQIGGVVTSAPAPFIAGALFAASGSWTWIAAYVALSSLISLAALIISRGDARMHRSQPLEGAHIPENHPAIEGAHP